MKDNRSRKAAPLKFGQTAPERKKQPNSFRHETLIRGCDFNSRRIYCLDTLSSSTRRGRRRDMAMRDLFSINTFGVYTSKYCHTHAHQLPYMGVFFSIVHIKTHCLGMFRSSTCTTNCFPAGGPKTPFLRFSILASIISFGGGGRGDASHDMGNI